MKIFVIFILLCIPSLCSAQSKVQTQERPGLFWYFSGLRPFKDIDRRKYDRLILDLTYNDWLGDNGPFENDWRSIGFGASLYKDIQLKRTENIGFGIGLGYTYLNHRTPRVFYVTPFSAVQAAIPPPNDSILSSFLTIHQFYIPLELRLRSKGWKHKKITLGLRIGIQPIVNISSFRTIEQEIKYSEIKLKEEHNWFYIAPYIRLGLRNWSIFFAYQPLNLFSETGSINMQPIQMGLSLSLF
jgi:hypothetical protein